MSTPQVETFLYDEANEDEFANHGLSAAIVDRVLESAFVLVRNRRGRRGLYLLIGQDYGGAFLSVPIEKTSTPGLWRPITAWPSKQSEISRLKQFKGRNNDQ
ncbi:MAG: hypothetical protein HY675_08080 [Chloroflexi bacterium]|nr:hypothetical protein [Chloroflexota bacterium]